jgi:glycosyltransferase involved in cell wall biosynthesis
VSPPVPVETFYSKTPEDYYLIVSELVAYKRVDSAIRVCATTGRKLRVVGDGPEYKALRRIANGNIEFRGKVGDGELRELYARCRAFLMPAEEDFGITAVEALASGKPVIALARGGALEIVPVSDPMGGLFFGEATDEALRDALERWEKCEHLLRPETLQAYAAKFSEAEFARKMGAVLFL